MAGIIQVTCVFGEGGNLLKNSLEGVHRDKLSIQTVN